MAENFSIALAGNPNAGKSTIFNALTGGHQHVGNWPGKTVAMKAGQFSVNGTTFDVVDLPGTYSLTAYSVEEIIARDYLIQERPDVVVAVVDAANLERNLYLVIQLIELDVPLIVTLNMADIAASRGLKIDVDALSARLGVPVLATVATRGLGLEELKAGVFDVAKQVRSHESNRPKHTQRTRHHTVRHCPKCG